MQWLRCQRLLSTDGMIQLIYLKKMARVVAVASAQAVVGEVVAASDEKRQMVYDLSKH